MNRLRRILIFSFAAALAGCTTFLGPQETPLLRHKTGKLLARDSSVPSRRFAAGFRLDSTADGLKLDFLGPLNTTLARLETSTTGATFRQPGHEPLTGENAEALMEKTLGFSVPLTAVVDWTEGNPNRDLPYHPIDSNAFEQLGWTVRVLDREANGSARKLSFTKDTLALVVVLDPRAGQ